MKDTSETRSPICAPATCGGTQSPTCSPKSSARTRAGGDQLPVPVLPQDRGDSTCVSGRLHQIADLLELAGKAITIVACARGIAYPSDIHRDAQRDLRALAELLVEHPLLESAWAASSSIHSV
jgi:hypothetical protein